MDDRELLDRAAKACGELVPEWYGNASYFDGVLSRWNPLVDDGDALRLAGNLDMQVTFEHDASRVLAVADGGKLVWESYNGDCHAAARRAIVRAAAAFASDAEAR